MVICPEEAWRLSWELSKLGLEETALDRPFATLSGGEQTRLAIAKLLLEQPSLLILDEPTNHLDFKTLGWLGHLGGGGPDQVLIHVVL